ncbi:hypothetical protein G6F59_015679 [Rhizopus arrhizus]|nr:hypothetical protein G6F59_015679 [Rhizopus arrhizus]
MCALRASSSCTTPFFCSAARAISTMPTAPATMRVRAAITALACCRCSIAWAISAARSASSVFSWFSACRCTVTITLISLRTTACGKCARRPRMTAWHAWRWCRACWKRAAWT